MLKAFRHQFLLNGEPYTIKVSPSQKRKHFALKVALDGDVVLHTPAVLSQAQIEDFLRQKQAWLEEHIPKLQAYGNTIPHYHYVSGERHLLLGDWFALKISLSEHIDYQHVPFSLHILTPDTRAQYVQKCLEDWWKAKAQEYLQQRLLFFSQQAEWIRTPPPFKIKKMKRQWGNCHHQGHLTFNTLLIQAPPRLVDYVIAHELTHLKHFNHSASFYQALATLLPDWQEREKTLDSLIPTLILAHHRPLD